MAITYEEALATLQSMFSDQGYTSQQLDAVLRHHGGHMENTVETLLTYGGGTPEELMAKLPSLPTAGPTSNASGGGGGGSNAHSFDADEELARQLAAEDEQRQQRGRARPSANQPPQGAGGAMARMFGGAGAAPGQRRPMASTVTAPSRKPAAPRQRAVAAPRPPAGTKGRGTPAALPADFLRIPGRKYPADAASSSPSTTASSNNNNNNNVSDPIVSAAGPGAVGQMMSDEQMARMLQDELFQEELRNNPEFSHLAGRGRAGQQVQATGRSTYGGAGGGAGRGSGVGWGERTDFFDRLSELGDNAKSRFQKMAASWNDTNAQPNQPRRPLFGGGGVGGSNAAPQTTANRGGNERRGLLANDLDMEEDEEEEMDFVGTGAGSANAFEMNDVVGRQDKKKD